jgi:hypothetical protein
MFQGFHAFMRVFLELLNAGSRYSHEKEKMSHLPIHLVNGGGHIVPGGFLGHNILGKV